MGYWIELKDKTNLLIDVNMDNISVVRWVKTGVPEAKIVFAANPYLDLPEIYEITINDPVELVKLRKVMDILLKNFGA